MPDSPGPVGSSNLDVGLARVSHWSIKGQGEAKGDMVDVIVLVQVN